MGDYSNVTLSRSRVNYVLQVLIDRNKIDSKLPCHSLCALDGAILPVIFSENNRGSGLIIEATKSKSPAPGFAFVFSRVTLNFIREQKIEEFLVRLRGDFVVDDNNEGSRAIDAEFVRGELPTGDRPKNSKFGIQGGLFESWFTISGGK
jgi:hypothetical protein